MKRGLVLVEGQTEERFVTECLRPYLMEQQLWLEAKVVTTKRVVGGPSFKGGVRDYAKVRNELRRFLNDTNVVVVTTLFDYYALPTDFPGMADRPRGTQRARCEHVEAAWSAAIDQPRFVPHVVLHELEAWVYALPAALEPWMFNDDPGVVQAIASIAATHNSPEDINEGPRTAPSKRLLDAFPAYQKTLHGPDAISAIGIDRIRAACPHFDQWLGRIEALIR